jgi:flagellar protein FliO/FliZ
MTWMIIRLILSLAFVAAVLLFAARLAKKRGLGQSNGIIEVVARQRMGRASSVNVVRIADVVLVVGATEEQVTLLAEVDSSAVDAALAERRAPAPAPARSGPVGVGGDTPALAGSSAARTTVSSGALAGSVFDRKGWGTFVNELRERTVRRP